jgi:hypothetical protein
MTCSLFVSFPLVIDTMIEDTRAVEKIVGSRCVDAGSLIGSGLRDMTFEFSTEARRDKAAAKLKAAGYAAGTSWREVGL